MTIDSNESQRLEPGASDTITDTIAGSADPAGATSRPSTARRRPSRVVVAALAVVVVAGAGQFAWQWRQNHRTRVAPGVNVDAASPDFDYVVPAGTAARLRSGDTLKVMPSVLRAQVGDVIRIRNDDIEAADIGPFRVPAGTTLTQKLTRKGTFVGFCVLSPTGRSQLIVS